MRAERDVLDRADVLLGRIVDIKPDHLRRKVVAGWHADERAGAVGHRLRGRLGAGRRRLDRSVGLGFLRVGGPRVGRLRPSGNGPSANACLLYTST